MSETFIHEICDSGFAHHRMTVVDKNYFISPNKKILCSECIGPWLEIQSAALADVTLRSVIGSMDVVLERDFYRYLADSDFSADVVDFMRGVVTGPFKGTIKLIYMDSENADRTPVDDCCFTVEMVIDPDGSRYSVENSFDPFRWLMHTYDDSISELDHPIIWEGLKRMFYSILSAYVKTKFTYLQSAEVELYIAANEEDYSSTAAEEGSCFDCCPNGTSTGSKDTCVVCGKGLVSPYYIYQNAAYCVDDMYAIVVEAAVKCNLSEVVGLAMAEETIPNTGRTYGSTEEFKISVIDKYFDHMRGFSNLIKAFKI